MLHVAQRLELPTEVTLRGCGRQHEVQESEKVQRLVTIQGTSDRHDVLVRDHASRVDLFRGDERTQERSHGLRSLHANGVGVAGDEDEVVRSLPGPKADDPALARFWRVTTAKDFQRSRNQAPPVSFPARPIVHPIRPVPSFHVHENHHVHNIVNMVIFVNIAGAWRAGRNRPAAGVRLPIQ